MLQWVKSWFIPKRPKETTKIVCLVGESGSGKTSLAYAMERYGFTSIASYTTRPQRGSKDKSHLFVSPKEFELIKRSLVAYQKFDGHEYGATKEQIQANHLFVIDPNGLLQLKESLPDADILTIYLSTSVGERLRRMVQTRGSDEALRRVDHDTAYFYGFRQYDLCIVNENEKDRERNELLLLGVLEKFYA